MLFCALKISEKVLAGIPYRRRCCSFSPAETAFKIARLSWKDKIFRFLAAEIITDEPTPQQWHGHGSRDTRLHADCQAQHLTNTTLTRSNAWQLAVRAKFAKSVHFSSLFFKKSSRNTDSSAQRIRYFKVNSRNAFITYRGRKNMGFSGGWQWGIELCVKSMNSLHPGLTVLEFVLLSSEPVEQIKAIQLPKVLVQLRAVGRRL